MDIQRVAPTIPTLQDLTEELYKAFDADEVNVEYIIDLMSNYKSNSKEWKKFAKFDRYKYTRNLVDSGNGKFNLMLLCWCPSNQSSIHDHSDAHCFMKMLSGSLAETRYSWPDDADQSMQEIGKSSLKSNEVLYINDSQGLHRVSNLSNSEEAVSLHLYSPPFQECQVFDEHSCQTLKCPMTFWSVYGEKVVQEKRGKHSNTVQSERPNKV